MGDRGVHQVTTSSVSVHIATPRAIASYIYSIRGRSHTPDASLISPVFANTSRMPLMKVGELWNLMLFESGHHFSPASLAAHISFGAYGAFDYLLACSQDLHSAFQRMQRYSTLASEAFSFVVEPCKRGLEIEIHPGPGIHLPTGYIEFIFCILLFRARQITGNHCVVERLDLQEERVLSGNATFDTPSCFANQTVNRIVISNDCIARQFDGSDPLLAELLESHLQNLVKTRSSADVFTNRVIQALHFGFSIGDVSLSTIANQIGLTERTLERRLRERGMRFRDILDKLRFEKMQQLLDSRFNVDEVTRILCYSEVRSFYRAFKRWYGHSPRMFLNSSHCSEPSHKLSEKVIF